jgi:hypothetical protein
MDSVIRRVSAIDSGSSYARCQVKLANTCFAFYDTAFFDFEDIPVSPVSLTRFPPSTISISPTAPELTHSPPAADEQTPCRVGGPPRLYY